MIAAAIDTGGTKIIGAAVDDTGRILEKVKLSNTGRTGKFIMDAYKTIIKKLQEQYFIEAIGIGAGGRIDEKEGKVLYAVGIYSDYIGLPIKHCIEKEFKLPVAVTNDCKAALIGEKWMGKAQKIQNVIGIILGTGVGGGVICDDKLLNGCAGGFGEIGHIILYPNGRACTCGQRGCAEQYLSGTALWSSYNEHIVKEKIFSGYEFFEKIDASDFTARKVLEQFKKDLAYFSVTCANVFDPEMLLFGGGLLDTAKYWWDDFVMMYHEIGSEHTRKKKLERAVKGNEAALLGAAKLAFERSTQDVPYTKGN